MAKESSFDIVSKVDFSEVANAIKHGDERNSKSVRF
jgi:uncharacterized protein YajQ (UPF0234 family)